MTSVDVPDDVVDAVGMRAHLARTGTTPAAVLAAITAGPATPSRQRELLALVREVAEADGDHATAAGAAYAQARHDVMAGRPRDARARIDAAAAAWRQAGDEVAATRCTLGLMHVLDDLGEHAAAVTAADEALATLSRLPPSDEEADARAWLVAALGENRGVALGYTGDHVAALAAARAAGTAYAGLGLATDAARAAGNAGVELLDLGRPLEALVELRRAAAGFRAADDPVYAAAALVHAARALAHLGALLPALHVVERAIERLDAAGAGAEGDRARLRRAATRIAVGQLGPAIAELRALVETCDTSGRRHDGAHARLLLATALVRDGDPTGEDVGASAVAAFLAVGDARNALRAELVRVDALVADDRAGTARPLLRAGLATCAGAGWPNELAQVQVRLAWSSPDDPRARELATAALAHARAHGLRDLAAQARHALGRERVAAGDVDGAIDELRGAAADLDSVRDALVAASLHATFLAGRSRPHEDLLRLLLDRDASGDADEALRVADRLRDHTLTARRTGLVTDGGPADQLARHRDRVLRRIATLRAAMDDDLPGPDGVRAARPLDGLLVELRTAGRELDALDARLAARPRGRATPPAPATDGLAGTVLAFHELDGRIVGFVRAGGGPTHVTRDLVTAATVRSLVGRLEGHWRRAAIRALAPLHERALAADAQRDLAALGAALLAPLADTDPHGTLTVVPHGLLHRVPFAALPWRDGALVDAVDVVVATSAATADLPPPAARDRRVLLLGAATPGAPAVEEEVASIAAGLGAGATLRTGGEATSDALRRLVADHAVVHLAGHGIHDDDDPDLSCLRLADGWVTAAELRTLDLAGRLVVLSACDTARRGIVDHGLATAGLTRALLDAGARGAVASLWTADDAATAELMRALHDALAGGRTLAAALSHAQRTVRAHRAHPYHWASFTCSTHGPPSTTVADAPEAA